MRVHSKGGVALSCRAQHCASAIALHTLGLPLCEDVSGYGELLHFMGIFLKIILSPHLYCHPHLEVTNVGIYRIKKKKTKKPKPTRISMSWGSEGS